MKRAFNNKKNGKFRNEPFQNFSRHDIEYLFGLPSPANVGRKSKRMNNLNLNKRNLNLQTISKEKKNK